MKVTQTLQKWYENYRRDLPWRNTSDPYKIWLSEIILQQTRVQQGLEYYLKFLKSFPKLEMLAKAEEDSIMQIWQGLGYYSRARNLHQTAKDIFGNGGVFPNNYLELIKLKGVGEYTAAAIASFAFDEPRAVVDGNVYRFLSRLYNISDPIDSTIGKKIFFAKATDILDNKNPGNHNQAIMEFGALQCIPSNPDCDACPFKNECLGYQLGEVNKLPVKAIKIKKRLRYFHYFIIEDEGYTYINKRVEKDIWKSLYEFPIIEKNEHSSIETILKDKEFKKLFNGKLINISSISDEKIHHLSHQKIYCKFIHIACKPISGSLFQRIPINSISHYAFPQLIKKYLLERQLL